MEASKCPKCGDEPHFVEQVEKWYCYGCNSYVEEEAPKTEEPQRPASPEAIADELRALEEEDKPTCANCGAELEAIKDGKLFCFVCESYPQEVKPEVKEEPKMNEAQALLETATKPEAMEATFEVAPVPITVSIPVPEPEPEPKKETPIEIKMCSVCGQPLKWIEKYQRNYCYGCRKYAPKEGSEKAVVAPKTENNGSKDCPECGKELKFIDKYSEYYCFACKKYPLRGKSKATERFTGPKANVLSCPKCGEPLKLVEKYQRHYCYICKEYAPKDLGKGPKEKKTCPACNGGMKFVPEYNEWYCYKCKKYSLRPNKPILLV